MLACVSAQSITWVFALYIPNQAATAAVCDEVFHVAITFLSTAISAAVWQYALNTLVINNTYSTFRRSFASITMLQTFSELIACRQAVVWKALKELNRPALHAQTLGFTHPLTGERLQFTSELPADFMRTLAQLDELK